MLRLLWRDFNKEYSIFTQDEDTEEFVRKVSGSIADLEIYKLIEKMMVGLVKARLNQKKKKEEHLKIILLKLKKEIGDHLDSTQSMDHLEQPSLMTINNELT